MAAVDVGGQLLHQVALIGNADGSKVPEMVVGIANRKLGLQGGLYGQS